MTKIFEKLEARVLLASLIVLFLASIGLAVAEQFFERDIKSSWSTPLILASLYFIVRLVAIIPDIGSNVKEIHTNLRSLMDANASIPVERIENLDNFYTSLTSATKNANATLDLTHIRNTPPADFGQSATTFFEEAIAWCRASENHTARRVISAGNPRMRIWARELSDAVADLPRFDIRVADWSSKVPAINFAIVDETVVYMALTPSITGRTKGVAMGDPKLAESFRQYYDNLFASSTPLSQWLAQNSQEA